MFFSYRIFCVKILKLNTDTEKYGKICSKEFCAKKKMIFGTEGDFYSNIPRRRRKIWTERRQEKKQKPW